MIAQQTLASTNLVFILWALVLDEELQALFPDLWLCSTTSTVATLWFISVATIVVILRLVRLANRFAFAAVPYYLHTRLGFANMPNPVCKRRVRLTRRIITRGTDALIEKYAG